MSTERVGRPTGPPSARRRLLEAALAHYEAGDLRTLTSAQIAEEVGVSPALVTFHFDSFEGLISAAGALRSAPHDVVAAAKNAEGQIDLGRLCHGVVKLWEHPEHGRRLAESAGVLVTGGADADLVLDYLQRTAYASFVESFGDAAAQRAAIVLVGAIATRYIVRLPSATAPVAREYSEQLHALMSAAVASPT